MSDQQRQLELISVRADDVVERPSTDPFHVHFDNLPDPAYMWRRVGDDYQLVAYNKAAGELSVSRPEQVIGSLASDLHPTHPTYNSDLERCDYTATVISRENDFRYRTTGAVRRLVMTFVPVFRGVVVAHHEDVTDKRKMEQRLRVSEERYKQAQRIAKFGSWERDIIKDETWWSDELFVILEEDPESCEGSFESFLARVHPDDRQSVLETRSRNWETARDGGVSATSEVRILTRSGKQKIVRLQIEVRTDKEGRPVTLVGTFHDVTERVGLEREIVAAGEHERNRIGRDLHDGLGQELTGISLGLEALAQTLSREQSPHLQMVLDLKGLTLKSIQETRRITRSLSPGFWGELGMAEALRSLAGKINEHAHVSCTVHCDEHADIQDPEVVSHLYRIAQEGTSNALRHADARNIELRYGRDRAGIYLEVVDDGVGIPPERDRVEGLGLRSMRYRAGMINGTLSVAARNGGGTELRCRLKVREE